MRTDPRPPATGRHVHALALSLTICPVLGLSSCAAMQDRPAEEHGVFLPFLNAPASGRPLADVPRLQVSLGGDTTAAEMDTGSTGLLVAARLIPQWETLPRLGPARLTYSSSGRVMEGHWVVTRVTVSGAGGAAVTTRPMPVMAVTRVSCLANARDCEPEEAPRHIAMLGIGFARQGDHQAQSTPDRNAFLSLPGMDAGTLGRGYVVTRAGVQVGLPLAAPESGFRTVQLARSAQYPDWSAAPACITITDQAAPSCGTVLIDTGVSRMFLTVSTEQAQRRMTDGPEPALRPGTRVAVELVPGDAPLGYSFRVGEPGDPVAPSGVTLVGIGRRDAFVNTSFHVLNGFDYLFDADRGLVGYRRASATTSR